MPNVDRPNVNDIHLSNERANTYDPRFLFKGLQKGNDAQFGIANVIAIGFRCYQH